jgi:hypothetical protein
MSNAMAAVQTWRYNIVAAAKPVTDRDNGQQPGRGCGTSGGVGAAPGAQEESAGGSTWRRGMRSGPGATCGPTGSRRSRPRTWTGSWRPPGAHPRPATSRPGTSSREQLVQLARVGPAAGHVAGSAATIALVAPRSDDPQLGDLIQFDLAQATMNIMVAAADLGIGSAHAGVHDQELARRLLGFPRTGLRPADHPRHPRRPPARPDPAARPAPVRRVVHRGHW